MVYEAIKPLVEMSEAEVWKLVRLDEEFPLWECPPNPTPLDLFIKEKILDSERKPQAATPDELASRGIRCPYGYLRYSLFVAVICANRDVRRDRGPKSAAISELRDLSSEILAKSKSLAMGLEALDFHSEPIGANVDLVQSEAVAALKARVLMEFNETALSYFRTLEQIYRHLDHLKTDLDSLPKAPADIWRQTFAFEMRRWWVRIFGASPPKGGGNSPRAKSNSQDNGETKPENNKPNRFTRLLEQAFISISSTAESVPFADFAKKASVQDRALSADRPWLSSESLGAGGVLPHDVSDLLLCELLYRLRETGDPDLRLSAELHRLIDREERGPTALAAARRAAAILGATQSSH